MVVRSAMEALVLLGLVLAAAPAGAHTVDSGPNGGRIEMAGPFHIELVALDGELIAYVSDAEHRPVATDAARATAIVLAGRSQHTIPLAPAAPNLLRGRAAFDRSAGLTVVLTLILPGRPPVQARFVLTAPR